MQIIVHPPAGKENGELLARRAGEIYAREVVRRITELSCPREQKLRLIRAVEETWSEKSGKGRPAVP